MKKTMVEGKLVLSRRYNFYYFLIFLYYYLFIPFATKKFVKYVLIMFPLPQFFTDTYSKFLP